MTLAPTNEAVRRDDQAEKNLCKEKKNRHDREVMEDVRTVLPSTTHMVLQEWESNYQLFLIILPTL